MTYQTDSIYIEGGRMRHSLRGVQQWLQRVLVTCSLVALAACSGGAKTEQNADVNGTQSALAVNYAGPAPESADVQAFKNEFWANVVSSSRCGGCHNQTGQSPSFARSDDVNAAYQQALQVVNLAQPDQSRVVAKVGGGHNCWTSSNSACADILTTWIRNWASAAGNTGSGTQISLTTPPDHTVGATKTFPSSSSLFGSTVYPLLTQYCSGCHRSNAAVPQKPFFASADVDEAYSEAKAKINLDSPALSRFVVRLGQESHNCWSNCSANAQTMLDAINTMIAGIPVTPVDPTLVLSKALTMYEGTIASGGNRYEAHTIAKYVFKDGTGSIAADTSGVDPAADLTLTGTSWAGGWGITMPKGGIAQVQGSSGNQKFYDRIRASGEFTIEAWVAPANVAQEDANMVSFDGGPMTRNFSLGQHGYQYEAFTRSSVTDTSGEPSLLTKDTDRDAQASLQHVVLTFDPVNGRKLYVNGVFTGDVDALGGGTLANWDNTFAFVLGNSAGGGNPWTGLIKFVAVHDRALTLAQVQQNFAAGVGERYYVLFNVTDLTGMPQSYVMFEVSQYDSYAYLFNKPTFISLDPNAKPGSIHIKGMRIGINGTEAKVGQAYIPLDVNVTDANYNATTGQLLSSVGTIVGLEKGPNSDLFFLTFEQIGSNSRAYTDDSVLSSLPTVDAVRPDVGYRTFEELDATMSKLTGVPRTNTTVKAVYDTVKQQLPTVENMDGFLSAHQIGIAQLGSAYCTALVNNATYRNAFFPSLNLTSNTLADSTQRSAVIDPLLNKTLNLGAGTLATNPTSSALQTEMNGLMDKLCNGGQCSSASRVQTVVTAVCTAAMASGVTTIQ